MAINIDWNLLRSPSIGSRYAEGQDERQRNMLVQNQLARQAKQDERSDIEFGRKTEDYNRLAGARTTAAPLVAAGKYGEASQAVAALDPELAGQFANLDKGRRAKLKEMNDIGLQVLGAAGKLPKGGARQQYVAQTLGQYGIDPAKYAVPELDDDNYIAAKTREALTVDQQLSQDNSDREFNAGRDDRTQDVQYRAEVFGETKRSNRVGEGQRAQALKYDGARLGLEEQRVQIARQESGRLSAGGLTPTQARKTETDLRKEFEALPEVKSHRIITQQAENVRRLAASPNAQNDIALIYSTMKAYDPTSVVRETEFATAQNAAGVPDQIRNAYNKALNGQRLNPKQRQEMAAAVGTVARSSAERYGQIEGQFRSYAQDYGANPERVAPKAPASAGKPDPLGLRK